EVGTKEITKEGFEYELTINFELINETHLVRASKDRTGLFMNKPEFIINSATGKKILDWCNSGTNLQDARNKIKGCENLNDLKVLYNHYAQWRELLEYDFKQQKDTITTNEHLLTTQNFSNNGSIHYQS